MAPITPAGAEPAAAGAAGAVHASHAVGAVRAAGAIGATGLPEAAGTPALALTGVGRAYGERVALADVSLILAPGETLAVLGPNGAGKTTLLRILATLLRPHAGEARVLGRPVPAEAWAVRGRIGLLGHEPFLYSELTARENLTFHARLHGVGEARVAALLDAVGLARRADEPVGTLSRGLTQRVAICRAVLHEPDLLLLDEPLANLDPGAAAGLGPLIGRESAAARVVISHDVEHGLAEADVVLGLRGGRPALFARADTLEVADLRELYA